MVSTESPSATEREETRPGFVQTKLPWIAGGAVLLIFLVTLNHWVNLRSLPVEQREMLNNQTLSQVSSQFVNPVFTNPRFAGDPGGALRGRLIPKSGHRVPENEKRGEGG